MNKSNVGRLSVARKCSMSKCVHNSTAYPIMRHAMQNLYYGQQENCVDWGLLTRCVECISPDEADEVVAQVQSDFERSMASWQLEWHKARDIPILWHILEKGGPLRAVKAALKAFPESARLRARYGCRRTALYIATTEYRDSTEKTAVVSAVLDAYPDAAIFKTYDRYPLFDYMKIVTPEDYCMSCDEVNGREYFFHRPQMNTDRMCDKCAIMFPDLELTKKMLNIFPNAAAPRRDEDDLLYIVSEVWMRMKHHHDIILRSNPELQQTYKLKLNECLQVGICIIRTRCELLRRAKAPKTTPLHVLLSWRLKGGHPVPFVNESLEILLRTNPSDIKVANHNGSLPIHIAIENKQIAMSKRLFQSLLKAHPSSVLIPRCDGKPPLIQAIEKGTWSWDLIKQLIGFDPRVLRKRDSFTGFYPFMVPSRRLEIDQMNVTYNLLRECPEVLSISGRHDLQDTNYQTGTMGKRKLSVQPTSHRRRKTGDMEMCEC